MTTTPLAAPTSSVGELTFDDVVAAAEVVSGTLLPTPVLSHPLLDRAIGREVVVKHENVLPTGAFKVRGGVHLASRLTSEERRRGLVTCSTGNHAQSVAYAGMLAGVAATVVMPSTAPSVKREAVEALGARVVVHGSTLGESAGHARSLAAAGEGFIDPTDPRIVLGHATAYLELFGAHPSLSTVYVPIGSGTGAVGALLVRDRLAPRCRVVGVQSSAAPAAWRSWQAGRTLTAPCRTRASGLATTTGYPSTQPVLRRGLADFLLVDDDQIDHAARLLATRAHTLAEGAGAASLAGLIAEEQQRASVGPVAVVVTGGNASAEELARILNG